MSHRPPNSLRCTTRAVPRLIHWAPWRRPRWPTPARRPTPISASAGAITAASASIPPTDRSGAAAEYSTSLLSGDPANWATWISHFTLAPSVVSSNPAAGSVVTGDASDYLLLDVLRADRSRLDHAWQFHGRRDRREFRGAQRRRPDHHLYFQHLAGHQARLRDDEPSRRVRR